MTRDRRDPARRTAPQDTARHMGRKKDANTWVWASAAVSPLLLLGVLIWAFGNVTNVAQRQPANTESTVQRAPTSPQGSTGDANTGRAPPRTASEPVPQGSPQGQR